MSTTKTRSPVGWPWAARRHMRGLGDDQEDAGADSLARQALGPALDDTVEREAGGLALVVAGVELLAPNELTPT